MRILLPLILLLALAAILALTGNRESGGPPAPPPEEAEPEEAPPPGNEPAGKDPDEKPAEGETVAPPDATPSRTPSPWDLMPVHVGPGPLLLTERRVRAEGPVAHEYGVADGAGGTEASTFLRHPLRVEVVGRFDRSRFLVGDADDRLLHVIDIENARRTPVPRLGRWVKIIEVERGEAYLRDDRGRLLAFSADAPERHRSLFNLPVREVLCTTADHLIVATAGDASEIWRVPKRSGPTVKVAEAPDGAQSYGTTWEPSPSGRHLAVSMIGFSSLELDPDTGQLNSPHGGTRIVLVDMVSGEARVLAKELNIGLSMFSSSFPKLEFTWVDEHTIRFSETEPPEAPKALEGGFFRWVDIDVRTGERLSERRYGMRGVSHDKPPRDLGDFAGGTYHWRDRVFGLFRRDGDKVYFRGEEEPAAVSVGPIAFSGAGRFCALLTGSKKEPVLTILDGESRTLRRLSGDAEPGFRWLPPAR